MKVEPLQSGYKVDLIKYLMAVTESKGKNDCCFIILQYFMGSIRTSRTFEQKASF